MSRIYSFLAIGLIGLVGCRPLTMKEIRLEMWQKKEGWPDILVKEPRGIHEAERYEQILTNYRASALEGKFIDDNFMTGMENSIIRKKYGWTGKNSQRILRELYDINYVDYALNE